MIVVLALCDYFFQNAGIKNTSNVYNSSRPASIANENHHLIPSAKKLKFSIGPTAPRPGPMFPTIASDAVREDIASIPLSDAISAVINTSTK